MNIYRLIITLKLLGQLHSPNKVTFNVCSSEFSDVGSRDMMVWLCKTSNSGGLGACYPCRKVFNIACSEAISEPPDFKLTH